MKYRRRGFEEARAEALRLAEAFLAEDLPQGGDWEWECGPPEPDQLAPEFGRRKPIVEWIVWIKPKPPADGTIDGRDGWILVDIEAREARWAESPGMRDR